jgi:hypothetical protein
MTTNKFPRLLVEQTLCWNSQQNLCWCC